MYLRGYSTYRFGILNVPAERENEQEDEVRAGAAGGRGKTHSGLSRSHFPKCG